MFDATSPTNYIIIRAPEYTVCGFTGACATDEIFHGLVAG